MNKFVFVFFLFCSACDVYTIKNNFEQRIVAGSFVISPGQCIEFVDIYFFGDFPIKFKYQNYHLMNEKTYSAGNYIVSEQGEIIKAEKACKIEVVGENPIKQEEDSLDKEGEETKEATADPPEGTPEKKTADSKDPFDWSGIY